jgi:signal transduction histidine kinase/ActR/RegA family two-component response regulator
MNSKMRLAALTALLFCGLSAVMAFMVWRGQSAGIFYRDLRTRMALSAVASAAAVGATLFLGFLARKAALDRERAEQAYLNKMRELEESYAALKRSDQMKSDFISSVSHELHTPLTVITVAVNNFLDGIFGPMTELQLKWIERVKSSSQRLTRLINDILDLSKLESGRIRLNRKKFNLGTLAHTIQNDLSAIAHDKGLTLDCELPPEPLEIFASQSRLEQVLVNLVTNAIKYSPSGSRILIKVQRVNQQAQVEVSDNGLGIDPSKLDVIFDRFMQLGADKTATPGIGLGLAICKEIVALHEGRIWAESEGIGKGSRFVFTIPLDPSRHDTARPEALVVEDDGEVLELLQTKLRQMGCEVTVARDGTEAIACIVASAKGQLFDFLLLDLKLPGRSGVQVIQEIKRVSPHTSVVVITGTHDNVLIAEALEHSPFTLLRKPFDNQQLSSVLSTVIRAARERIQGGGKVS